MPHSFPEPRNQVNPPKESNSRIATESPTSGPAIPGSMPVSGLRGTVGRLLMHAATALGLDTKQTSITASNSEINVAEEASSPNRTQSFFEWIGSSFFESRLFKTVSAIGATFAGFLAAAWNYLTRETTEQIFTRGVPDLPTQQYTPRASETPAITFDSRPHQPVVIVEPSVDDVKEKVDIFTVAMEQAAEAARHKKEEEEAAQAEEADRDFRERLSHARGIIGAIDARGGTTANNPKVRAVLASLGTPYDSIQHAIAVVEALQVREREDETKLQ